MDDKESRTIYQKRNRPVSVREVLCPETRTEDGFCVQCKRYSGREGIRSGHKPNTRGALGFIETYGDGSTRTAQPGKE